MVVIDREVSSWKSVLSGVPPSVGATRICTRAYFISGLHQ